VWDADLGRYVDPLYEQWAAEARQRQRLAAERESQEGIGFWDWVQGGLDAGGVVEPTPFCDLASGVISAFRGNWADAGCSALAMIPYVGDTAKAAKYGRKAAKLANRAGDAAHAADKADDLRKASSRVLEARIHRSFPEKLADIQGNPDKWEAISAHAEKASRKGARQHGASTQTIYRNRETGETIVHHTVTDDAGRVIDDHFRPNYRPRAGDLNDGR